MQAKAAIGGQKDLYAFWGKRLYDAVRDESGIIINLASKEYAKCIENYLTDADRSITITFCEKSGDKLVTKGTYAKMARGEMVRFMAESQTVWYILYRGGFTIMETWFYEVVSIDGDYANLRRTDIQSDDIKLVARALLPAEIVEGSKLKYELMQYEIME